MPEITITDHGPYCEAASDDTVHFEYDGQPFYVENWATRHGSGIDIYDPAHRPVEPFAAGQREEFEEQIRAFLAALGAAEEAHGVQEVRRAALATALAAFNDSHKCSLVSRVDGPGVPISRQRCSEPMP